MIARAEIDAQGRILRLWTAPSLALLEAMGCPADAIDAPPGVAAGTHEWDGSEWVALPPPEPGPAPVPAVLTRVQFLLVADSIGFTEAGIAALIAADNTLTEAERNGLLIRFNAATQFPRDWPHLDMLAAGLTPAQIDDLFRLGATL